MSSPSAHSACPDITHRSRPGVTYPLPCFINALSVRTCVCGGVFEPDVVQEAGCSSCREVCVCVRASRRVSCCLLRYGWFSAEETFPSFSYCPSLCLCPSCAFPPQSCWLAQTKAAISPFHTTGNRFDFKKLFYYYYYFIKLPRFT